LTEDIDKLGKPGYVLFSTIKAFKGLEAENVILLHADIPGRTSALTDRDLYVACTRAIGRLVILTAAEDAQRWFLE
jgi:superfamily I DNA/RNA helicase